MAHPVDEYVGKKLRERRTLMGMSQENLAKTVDITFQQVQKYERGANRMSASRLYQFSKTLSVPVGFFFEGFEEQDQANGMADTSMGFEHEDFSSRESLELMKAYHRIKEPKAKRAINDLIRSMADGAAILDS